MYKKTFQTIIILFLSLPALCQVIIRGKVVDANSRQPLEAAYISQKGNDNITKFSSLAKIDLDLKPVRNTQELMRLVPDLFVAQHAGGGKAEQIFYVALIVIMEQIYR